LSWRFDSWYCARLLGRRARQPQPVANARRVSRPLVDRCAIRAAALPRISLDGSPDLVCSRVHRFEAVALNWIGGIEREPDGDAVGLVARPRRLLVRTSCPFLGRTTHVRASEIADREPCPASTFVRSPDCRATARTNWRALAPSGPERGRPWVHPLRRRVEIVCAARYTNLTIRELAAIVVTSKSTIHRIIMRLTPAISIASRP
jgi:hypothetical protein